MNSWFFFSSHFAFFVFINFPLSSSFDSYTYCSNAFNCGDITEVGFPFWGDGRPESCGYPELKLTCSNDVTAIEIMGVKYRLLKINQGDQTLKIVRDDYCDKVCSPKFGDTKLNSKLFDYVVGSSDVTLLYDCTSSSKAEYFSCPDDEAYEDVAAIPADVPESPICKSKVVVRISDAAFFRILGIQNATALEAVVREGFEVKYKVDSEKCGECVSSKGVCGYDWNLNETVCHCANQASESRICSAATAEAIDNPAAVPPPAKGHIKLTRKHIKITRDTLQEYIGGKHDLSELMIYDFDSILVATDNFSIENKLGQGGFGPVYWGKLAEGKEIAVKRLSSTSGQGVVEFKNEMLLISNLQHKNLVRIMEEYIIIQSILFCCCVKEDEKLLIYEFMANKSLDTFLFGYGYMSPEYAMGGIFSKKSDVYSFGVLVLEIISSKKNTAFYIYDRQLGLLAYAWQLWKEGRELELVDEMLAAESYSASEVMKCVHIGLLCVQDNAMDRPSMPDVVFMLNGSTTVIGGAQPKQPLFTIQNTVSHPQPQPSNTFLTNEATMTLIEGR
ncbi:unnamed protein product [Malus baccata var. baccata]